MRNNFAVYKCLPITVDIFVIVFDQLGHPLYLHLRQSKYERSFPLIIHDDFIVFRGPLMGFFFSFKQNIISFESFGNFIIVK